MIINSNIEINNETLYLIQFELVKNGNRLVLYTLMAYGDEEDRPIMDENKIIFFDAPEMADIALSHADNNMKHLGPPPKEVALVCNIPKTIHLVREGTIDPQSIILDCLNTLFDMINSLNLEVRDDYKKLLYPFADYLTFHHEFATCIDEREIDHAAIKDSINWCMAVIFSRSKYLSAKGWDEGLLTNNIIN